MRASDATPPPGIRSSMRYFPEIESLRGIAIMLVVAYHLSAGVLGVTGPWQGVSVSPLRAFLQAGHTGVSLFFILSAFLLSLPFLREGAGGKRVRRREYYLRRALRILPLYYTAVIAAAVLSAGTPAQLWRGVPYLFFLNAVGLAAPLHPYSSVWWSLATEVQFYLLLPLLPFFLGSRARRQLGVVVLSGYAVAYAGFVNGVVVRGNVEARVLIAHSVFGRGPLFLLGIAAARLYSRCGADIRAACMRRPWARNGGVDLVLVAVLAGLGLVLQRVAFAGYWVAEYNRSAWHLAEGGLWTAVVLLLLLAPVRIKPLFSNRILNRIGLLSYSIYILHAPLIHFALAALERVRPGTVAGWNPFTVAAAMALSVTCVALATLTYGAIERPFLVRKAALDQ
jgi:peptidoglycan/LPS O-acetylase OafA/YrhL